MYYRVFTIDILFSSNWLKTGYKLLEKYFNKPKTQSVSVFVMSFFQCFCLRWFPALLKLFHCSLLASILDGKGTNSLRVLYLLTCAASQVEEETNTLCTTPQCSSYRLGLSNGPSSSLPLFVDVPCTPPILFVLTLSPLRTLRQRSMNTDSLSHFTASTQGVAPWSTEICFTTAFTAMTAWGQQ